MRLSEDELTQRGTRVQELLRPISVWPTGPAWERLAIGTTLVIIGTHDQARPTSHFRDWRFKINFRRHYAMYFEAWRRERRNSFVVERAYLNIYERIDTGERELVCLHCDPSLSPDEAHARYKRGPHIHMSVAGFPFDAAHIALQGPDLDAVLASAETLHAALQWGIEMIRDEILTLIPTQN